ncbi:MAG: hypothetical protein MHM6MM_005007 [Cercozoa sp. M6MM]
MELVPSAAERVLCCSFNQDGSALAVGTTRGMRIYRIAQIQTGGIKAVLALVGGAHVSDSSDTSSDTANSNNSNNNANSNNNNNSSNNNDNNNNNSNNNNNNGNRTEKDSEVKGSFGGVSQVAPFFRSSLAFAVGDGRARAFSPRKIRVLNLRKHGQRQREALPPPKHIVGEINFNGSVNRVASNRHRLVVTAAHKVHVFDVSQLRLLHSVATPYNRHGTLALAPTTDNRRCFAAWPCSSADGRFMLYDAFLLKTMAIVRAHQHPIARLAFDSSGTLLASSSTRGTVVRVWAVPSGKRIAQFRRGTRAARIESMQFSPSGAFLAVVSSTNTVHVFSLPRQRSDSDVSALEDVYDDADAVPNASSLGESSSIPTAVAAQVSTVSVQLAQFVQRFVPASVKEHLAPLRPVATRVVRQGDTSSLAPEISDTTASIDSDTAEVASTLLDSLRELASERSASLRMQLAWHDERTLMTASCDGVLSAYRLERHSHALPGGDGDATGALGAVPPMQLRLLSEVALRRVPDSALGARLDIPDSPGDTNVNDTAAHVRAIVATSATGGARFVGRSSPPTVAEEAAQFGFESVDFGHGLSGASSPTGGTGVVVAAESDSDDSPDELGELDDTPVLRFDEVPTELEEQLANDPADISNDSSTAETPNVDEQVDEFDIEDVDALDDSSDLDEIEVVDDENEDEKDADTALVQTRYFGDGDGLFASIREDELDLEF